MKDNYQRLKDLYFEDEIGLVNPDTIAKVFNHLSAISDRKTTTVIVATRLNSKISELWQKTMERLE